MTFGSIVSYFFFQLFVPLLFALSIVSFIWGFCLYTVAGDRDGELSDNGKVVMLYGLISLVVTAVIFGLLSFIRAAIL